MYLPPISVGERLPAATGRLAIAVLMVLAAAACGNSGTTQPIGDDMLESTTTAIASPTTTAPPPLDDTWLLSTDPVFRGSGHQLISDVGLGGPGMIAVGIDSSGDDADAAVWISPDGQSWSRVDDPALGGPEAQGLEDLVVSDAGIVAVGFDSTSGDIDAAAWFSVDGLVWEKAGGTAFVNLGHEEVRTVVATESGFIAAGFAVIGGEADAAMWVSPDGRTWNRLDDPSLGGGGTQRISSLVVGPNGLVAGGTNFLPNEFGLYELDARVWVSADGSTWSAIDDATFGGPGWQYITSVVSGPDGLVAAGGDILGRPGEDNDAAVWTSPDGLVWTRVADSDFARDRAQQISALTVGANEVIAVGYDTGPIGNRLPAVWLSPDGTSWVRVADPGLTEPGHRWMSGIAAGDTAVVAVGTDGTRNAGDPAVWLLGPRRGPRV